jgi:hypothetical protein
VLNLCAAALVAARCTARRAIIPTRPIVCRASPNMGSCCSTTTTAADAAAPAGGPVQRGPGGLELDDVATVEDGPVDAGAKGAARGAWARGAPNASRPTGNAAAGAGAGAKKTVVTATAVSSTAATAPPPPRLFPPQPSWASLTGTVVHVADGDTCEVAEDGTGKRTRVRFAFIDAPESKQTFGPEGKAMLAGMVLRQHVTVYVTQVRLRAGSAQRVSRRSPSAVAPSHRTAAGTTLLHPPLSASRGAHTRACMPAETNTRT